MKKILISICILLIWTSAFAMPDTPENREREAVKYLQTTPPENLFRDMAEKVSMQLPEEQRDAFKATLTKNLDIEALSAAMRGAMVKYFSADELSALADFYGSPVGKSAMSKFGPYMAEMMPAMQAEMAKAIQKTQAEFSAK
ncbi:DUF2059 domain-containing protein [uncultured Desulfobacter sp.]|uniref:DUF2059 domain-containing protein n=1 Tax=uncultured Desulfobacter sp. TaxID=240139 RepID=UPI002AAB3A91|nr:DUF2059 domain-containing protein [uncultured Desulfobacter sp.]